MSYPQAYEPIQDQKFQILVMTPYERAYEHCDYAVDEKERDYLLQNYRMSYGVGHIFKTIRLPRKYWKKD